MIGRLALGLFLLAGTLFASWTTGGSDAGCSSTHPCTHTHNCATATCSAAEEAEIQTLFNSMTDLQYGDTIILDAAEYSNPAWEFNGCSGATVRSGDSSLDILLIGPNDSSMPLAGTRPTLAYASLMPHVTVSTNNGQALTVFAKHSGADCPAKGLNIRGIRFEATGGGTGPDQFITTRSTVAPSGQDYYQFVSGRTTVQTAANRFKIDPVGACVRASGADKDTESSEYTTRSVSYTAHCTTDVLDYAFNSANWNSEIDDAEMHDWAGRAGEVVFLNNNHDGHTVTVDCLKGYADSSADFPQRITIDRNVFEADRLNAAQRAIWIDGKDVVVKNNYFSGIKEADTESKVLLVSRSDNLLIENNFICCTTIGALFGGNNTDSIGGPFYNSTGLTWRYNISTAETYTLLDTWTADTVFEKGKSIQRATGGTHIFIAETAGTSGSTEPSWSTAVCSKDHETGSTTTDNTITWRCAGTTDVPRYSHKNRLEFKQMIDAAVHDSYFHNVWSDTDQRQLWNIKQVSQEEAQLQTRFVHMKNILGEHAWGGMVMSSTQQNNVPEQLNVLGNYYLENIALIDIDSAHVGARVQCGTHSSLVHPSGGDDLTGQSRYEHVLIETERNGPACSQYYINFGNRNGGTSANIAIRSSILKYEQGGNLFRPSDGGCGSGAGNSCILKTAVWPARDNRLIWSNDFTQTWSGTATVTADADVTPYWEQHPIADVISDSSGAAAQTIAQSATILNDSLTYTCAFYIKKDTDTSRFPEICTTLSGGTGVETCGQFNLSTGLTSVRTGAGAITTAHRRNLKKGGVSGHPGGDYWRVEVTAANNSTGNTTGTCTLKPAFATSLGGAAANTATGAVTTFCGMLYESGTPSAALTNVSCVSSNGDALVPNTNRTTIPPGHFDGNIIIGTETATDDWPPDPGGAHPGNSTIEVTSYAGVGFRDQTNEDFVIPESHANYNQGHDGLSPGPDWRHIPRINGFTIRTLDDKALFQWKLPSDIAHIPCSIEAWTDLNVRETYVADLDASSFTRPDTDRHDRNTLNGNERMVVIGANSALSNSTTYAYRLLCGGAMKEGQFSTTAALTGTSTITWTGRPHDRLGTVDDVIVKWDNQFSRSSWTPANTTTAVSCTSAAACSVSFSPNRGDVIWYQVVFRDNVDAELYSLPVRVLAIQ